MKKKNVAPVRHEHQDDDLFGDLIDFDFDFVVEPRAEKTRFLVEALGVDFFPPPDLPR